MSTSKFANVLMGMPGWIVFVMTAVWWTPFCIRDVMEHPTVAYWDSHLLYAVLLGMGVLSMLTVNSLQSATGFWSRAGVLLRILSIVAAYALTMFVSLVVLLGLDSTRVLHYYGGDAGGSAGLLIIPSVIVYSVVGGALGAIVVVVRLARREIGSIVKREEP